MIGRFWPDSAAKPDDRAAAFCGEPAAPLLPSSGKPMPLNRKPVVHRNSRSQILIFARASHCGSGCLRLERLPGTSWSEPCLSRIAQTVWYISINPDHDVFGDLTEIWIADAEKSDGAGVRWGAGHGLGALQCSR
jgi:hypothetical protein